MSRRNSSQWPALAAAIGGAAVIGAVVSHAHARSWRRRIERAYFLASQGIGVEPPVLVFSDRVCNAHSDGEVIAINPRWARSVLREHCGDDICTDQVLVGVLAHELAHHAFRHAHLLQGVLHTSWETWVRYEAELDADWAAGAALARLRLGAREFSRVLALLSLRGSMTHPIGYARVAAIRDGYLSMAWS